MRTIVLLLTLSACASAAFTPQEIYAPDGNPAMFATCGHQMRCHSMARDYCKGAYIPLNEGVGSTLHGYTTPQGYGSVQGGSVYSLTFRCK